MVCMTQPNLFTRIILDVIFHLLHNWLRYNCQMPICVALWCNGSPSDLMVCQKYHVSCLPANHSGVMVH